MTANVNVGEAELMSIVSEADHWTREHARESSQTSICCRVRSCSRVAPARTRAPMGRHGPALAPAYMYCSGLVTRTK
jgi:hypothetical protein